jgi:hypothetical protein
LGFSDSSLIYKLKNKIFGSGQKDEGGAKEI